MILDQLIDSYRDEIIQTVREMVAIPSMETEPLPGKPFGEGIDRMLKYALELSSRLGFKTKNIDGYGGYADFGEGDETLGILVHLDVVPVGDGWSYPPFGGEVHDGKIYGRGAIDDKGPAVAALYAMKAVMDSGLRTSKKVRMIFGTDEESGWKDMDYIFAREPMPDFAIVPDGNYPVIHAEKGILTISLKKTFQDGDSAPFRIRKIVGGQRPNVVPDECTCCFLAAGDEDKILLHLNTFKEYSGYDMSADFDGQSGIVVKAAGKSAHASTPEKGRNAIGQMLAFLSTLGMFSSEKERFILLLNDKIGMDYTGRLMDAAVEDKVSGKLTLNLGMIELDQNRGKAVINIRYPVTYTMEQILSRIQSAFAGTGVEVRVIDHSAPLYLPKDHFLVQRLIEVYTRVTGKPAQPLAIGGGTYARAIQNAVAFGAVFPEKPELAHQRDEYISIDDLMLHARIYAHAIYELVK